MWRLVSFVSGLLSCGFLLVIRRQGLCLWERAAGSKEEMERAAEHFVKSAKLDPNNAAAFKYLGHYYGRGGSDGAQRAVKCYQRAVVLNPDDQESGVICVHIYSFLFDTGTCFIYCSHHVDRLCFNEFKQNRSVSVFPRKTMLW